MVLFLSSSGYAPFQWAVTIADFPSAGDKRKNLDKTTVTHVSCIKPWDGYSQRRLLEDIQNTLNLLRTRTLPPPPPHHSLRDVLIRETRPFGTGLLQFFLHFIGGSLQITQLAALLISVDGLTVLCGEPQFTTPFSSGAMRHFVARYGLPVQRGNMTGSMYHNDISGVIAHCKGLNLPSLAPCLSACRKYLMNLGI